MTDISLVTIIISPSLEETLVDWLLSHEGNYGFTSFPVSGHSIRHGHLSLEEQVAGRQKQVRFEMHVRGDDVAGLLTGLKTDFTGTGLHYWVAPILESGGL